MKIYFSCSLENIVTHKSNYLEIIQNIKENSATLTRDWVENAINNIENGKNRPPRSELYSEIMKAIIDSDLCIFDVTEQSMSVGHQLTYALDKRRPTLLLINKSNGYDPNDLFISGSKSGYLTVKDYSSHSDIKKIVRNFILKNKNQSKTRLNLALDKHLADFLEWLSFKDKTTKTGILQSLIIEKMNSTPEYKEE